jgi:dTDP-4-dehydrorhamnose reductase
VAGEVAALLGVRPAIEGITMDQLRLKAPRPRFCALSTAKIAATGFTMPSWQDALRRWLAGRAASTE